MTATTVDLRSVVPLSHREAAELGRVEYRRLVAALESLTGDDWLRPTDCEGWRVRDLAGHLCGSMMTVASFRNTVTEQRQVKARVRQTGQQQVDAMTALQVEKTADMTTAEIVDTMRSLIDRAANGRRRPPKPVAALVRFPVAAGPINEKWSLGYLLGTILTRDTWLHRVADLARAVDRQAELDDHDRRIVTDVAAEWARRHGHPVELALSGAAGGNFAAGSGGPRIELDAVEFCRILSGRSEPTHPLLATAVPF